MDMNIFRRSLKREARERARLRRLIEEMGDDE
jgi:hypothetical protein